MTSIFRDKKKSKIKFHCFQIKIKILLDLEFKLNRKWCLENFGPKIKKLNAQHNFQDARIYFILFICDTSCADLDLAKLVNLDNKTIFHFIFGTCGFHAEDKLGPISIIVKIVKFSLLNYIQ